MAIIFVSGADPWKARVQNSLVFDRWHRINSWSKSVKILTKVLISSLFTIFTRSRSVKSSSTELVVIVSSPQRRTREKKQLLTLVRDFASEKSQGERRISNMKNRIGDFRSSESLSAVLVNPPCVISLVNTTASENREGSIANVFGRVLEEEFSENDQPESIEKTSFNSSVADDQATVVETVALIKHEKAKKDETREANGTKPFQFQDVFFLDNEISEDITALMDKKDNMRVMSNKKSKYPVLQVDLRLIYDLVVVIVSAAIGGIIFFCLGQPVVVDYLLAGSIIGFGGLKFVKEIVQVETFAQFGNAQKLCNELKLKLEDQHARDRGSLEGDRSRTFSS